MGHSSLFAVLVCCFLTSLVGTSCGAPPPTITPVPSSTETATSTVLPAPTVGADVAWLRTQAIPFVTTQPDGDQTDLNPLKAIVGNARIVALGEATHGTHEFFQMKHRMLEFLFEQMGFTAFAMEANGPEASLVNDYVHTGQGDPAELLKGMYFWVWDTREVLEMIQWMRVYNQDPGHAQKISFYGFDMQYGQMARNNVAQYMREVDPPAANQVADDYSCYPGNSVACRDKLQDVFDWLEQHQVDYTAKSSEEEFRLALHSARVVVQYQDYTAQNNSVPLRDRYMAENVTWILDQAGPDARIVLWAHNGHVGLSGEEHLRMGDYLRKQYGDQMVVFGFLFYQGSFHAYGAKNLETFEVGAPPADSYESFFHEAGLQRFFLDLRSAKAGGAGSDWLLVPHPFRMIGSAYFPNESQVFFKASALAETFDVAIYFQDTTASQLLTK